MPSIPPRTIATIPQIRIVSHLFYNACLDTSLNRDACNSNSFRPKDMFNYIYGYACGEDGGGNATCATKGIGSTGRCPNGDEKENYFITAFLNTANAEAKADMPSFKVFGSWLVGTMVELMYLHLVCLPLDGNTYAAFPDSSLEETMKGMKTSFVEVAENLRYVEVCVSIRPDTPDRSSGLPICALNYEGFPISEDLPEYKQAKSAYSDVSVDYAQETGSDITETLGKLLEATESVSDALGAAAEFVAFLGGLGAGLSILTHFLGKSETDLTQELIKQEFDKTNRKIDILSGEVAVGFSDLKTDLGDARLDDLMGQLSVVKRAYDDFMLTRGNSTDNKSVKRKYREEFR
jgi:hypothetical protein